MLNVTLDNVTFSYDSKLVLGGVSFDEAGHLVCLFLVVRLRQDTLLRLLAGLENPTWAHTLTAHL